MTDDSERRRAPGDAGRASAARLYSTYQHGSSGNERDRDVARQVADLLGDTELIASSNRGFVRRAVRTAAAEFGIGQFLDVGAGVPQEPNTHQVAQAVRPSARVVYVDNDLSLLRDAEALLDGTPQGTTAYLHADVRDPAAVLSAARRTLDLSRPVAVVLAAVLHFVPDEDDPRGVVEAITAPLAPGSCVILSHGTDEFAPAAWRAVEELYREQGIPTQIRSKAEIAALVDGFDLVEPGLVEVHQWRPDTGRPAADDHRHCYGALGLSRG
ncbi:SAM-dependent methyltransferase [Streptomyces sp. NPDC058045]|uniref:SAM-dependent methyltransferase n=1 Tax=Streptomyces sp. NPDC058045 TaxID=3346311 RepID=UPI0036E1055A